MKDNKEYKTVIKKGYYSSGYNTLFLDHGIYNSIIEKVKLMGDIEFENNSMKFLFFGCTNLKEIDITNLDFSKISNIANWLNNCTSITNQDQIKGFNNLSKLTNMYSVFDGLSKIQSLNLSTWDTSKVTNMHHMFAGCSSLKNLDLSNFNTTNVTNMQSMFERCNSLIRIDISNFNTSKVTNMIKMFSECSSLTSLDLSSFDTSKVTNMSGIFNNCNTLKKLNILKFNTSGFNDSTFSSVPDDIVITTNEEVKTWLNENYPNISNITVV